MINFIPIAYYTALHYHILLLVMLLTWLHTQNFSGFSRDTFVFNSIAAKLLLWYLLLYMGLRPISFAFGDMGIYAKVFDIYAMGGYPNITEDMGFYTLMRVFSFFQLKKLFFFVVVLLYVVPIYFASKKWFPNYYYFAFLILAGSFSFWAYGTNGLRNGVATSLMIWAFSVQHKRYKYILFLIAYSFHSSMLLPIGAYFITLFIKNSRIYFGCWVLSIFLSLLAGDFFENLIVSIGLGSEDKLQMYFGEKEKYASEFAYTGFRWDFLLYSSMAVIIAYYFIYIKKFKDKHYMQLTNIYLLANAFWILVIRASFSNRFAYLSWFMMGLIIIYPYLKQVYWKNQFSIIGMITILYFSFTYIMNVILLK